MNWLDYALTALAVVVLIRCIFLVREIGAREHERELAGKTWDERPPR